MKTNRAYGFAFATAFAILAACSGNNQGVQEFGPDGGIIDPGTDGGHQGTGTGSGIVFVIPDSGHPGSGTGSGTEPGSGTGTGGGGGMCPSSCTSDSECQSGCPASPGAINCCDTVTSACFTSASSSCPDTTSSGSGSGGY